VTQPASDVMTVASRLRAAVEETAAALAVADLDRLLAADIALQAALAQRPSTSTVDPALQPFVRRELEAARTALARCRRLGAGLTDFVRLSFDARGQWPGYEPARAAAVAFTGRGLDQKA